MKYQLLLLIIIIKLDQVKRQNYKYIFKFPCCESVSCFTSTLVFYSHVVKCEISTSLNDPTGQILSVQGA